LVNRSGGRVVLLKDPALICQAVKAMRIAVPNLLPVTVKVSLG